MKPKLIALNLILLAGLLLLLAGYGLHVTSCKFLGFLTGMTGLICLIFVTRSNELVVHPMPAPPPTPPRLVNSSIARHSPASH